MTNTQCSGIAAVWCPVHGDCTCKDRENSLDDGTCPLHAWDSTHAEGCDHDWRANPFEVFTTDPPQREHRCAKCGERKLVAEPVIRADIDDITTWPKAPKE